MMLSLYRTMYATHDLLTLYWLLLAFGIFAVLGVASVLTSLAVVLRVVFDFGAIVWKEVRRQRR